MKKFKTLLGFNACLTMFVIVWGAFVRATGSGAGCGSHWPLCNGEVIPVDPSLERIIEFTHRTTSGLLLITVLIMYFMSRSLFKTFRPDINTTTGQVTVFLILEALIGAILVIFGLVEYNDTVARAFMMGIHLINTFMLIGCLAHLCYQVFGANKRTIADIRWDTWPTLLGVGLIFMGATGSMVALGDTLFPAESLAEGLAQDLNPNSHWLIKLRVIHPIMAVIVVLSGIYGLTKTGFKDKTGGWALALTSILLLQFCVGMSNWLLLAPTWIQLIHLWLAEVMFGIYVIWLAVRSQYTFGVFTPRGPDLRRRA